MKKLLIIDGNNVINRSFYGVRPLTNSDGLPTNALYGMLNMLLKQLETVSPDYAAIAFDLPSPTFRHKMFDEYKAGRKRMPDELALQLPYGLKLAEALGIQVVTKEGYEADDLLGSYSKLAANSGVFSYIMTGDRDCYQLIGEMANVLYLTNSDTVIYDSEKFISVYGVPPSAFVDIKALMGDSSDNIPGIAGIGQVSAVKLIATYGSLDGIYENLEKVDTGRGLRDKITSGKEIAYLSKTLAQIDCDVPLDLDLSQISYTGIKKDELYTLLNELQFYAHIKKLGLSAPIVEEQLKDTNTAEKPLTINELQALKKGVYSLVIEDGELGIFDDNSCRRLHFGENSEIFRIISELDSSFIVHDYKQYCKLFDEAGIDFKNCAGDIILSAYVLNPSTNITDLGELTSFHLKQSAPKSIAEKAECIYRLHSLFMEKFVCQAQRNVYTGIEIPLARVLFLMEKRGFTLDLEGLSSFSARLLEMSEELTNRVYMAVGHEFNLNSPKQLGDVLFGEMKLPNGKKTKTGFSTNAEILEELRADYPIVDDILEYRTVSKLRSTYAEGLTRLADETGKVHTTFNQTVTATGRLSSTEPNLQNIPIRRKLGREMRKFFVSKSDDYLLIDADYSQIELRILAHIAGDERMIDAFKNGVDIHAVTASQVFGVPLDRVDSEMRKRAKAVNFGIVYGISDYALSLDIGVTPKQAKAYIKNYFETYSSVASYLDATVKFAKEHGYVETIFGRRRYIPEISSQKAMMRAFGERVAMNSPIQGSSADIIKLAMIECEKKLCEAGLDAHLILQIHDELIVESHKDCASEATEILRRTMEDCVKLSLPLTVEVSSGKTWYECKE